jgi:hypothetical protein
MTHIRPTIRFRNWTIGAAALAGMLSSVATTAGAQTDRWIVTAAQCDTAVSSLQGGSPPPAGDRTWWIATRCGAAGGSALATVAANALRTVSDTERVAVVEAVLAEIRDFAVFQSMLGLAEDATAAAPSREAALRVVLAQHERGLRIRTPIVFRTPSETCATWSPTVAEPRAGAPLPADYATRAHAAAGRVANATAAPASLRLVASCVRGALRAFVPPTIVPSTIRLTYLCGNRFRVRNPNADWADVRYDVYRTDDGGDLTVPPNGEIVFTTERTGTTRLFYAGRLVQTKANGGATCTA